MKTIECERAKGLLPERFSGSIDPTEAEGLDAHLATCEECAMELELVAALRAARVEPPPGAADRVRAALRSEFERTATAGSTGRWHRVGWGLAAAAILVLAASPVLFRSNVPEELDPLMASLEAAPSVWLTDEGTIAGALVIDDLSDEELLSLLEGFEG